jgi:hypothetical protein
MKGILLVLPGVMLCAATLHSAAADPAVPLQTKTGEELHSAVTDMPAIVDMSHANPKSWHSLPPAAQVYDQVLSKEVQLPTHFSGRPRPF